MDIQLERKYPNAAEIIGGLRRAGWDDLAIERFFTSFAEQKRFTGWSEDDIRKFFGTTPEVSYDVWSFTQEKARKAYADLFNIDFTPAKDDTDTFQSLFGVIRQTKSPYTAVDPFSFANQLLYPAAKFTHEAVVKPAFAWSQLSYRVADWIVPDGTMLDDWIKRQLQYFSSPESTTTGRYVGAVEQARRKAYRDMGFLWGLANDLSTYAMDFMGIMASYMMFGGMARAPQVMAEKNAIVPTLQRIVGSHPLAGKDLLSVVADQARNPALRSLYLEGYTSTANPLLEIARRAKLTGLHAFLTTPGDLTTRAMAGLYRVFNNLTPYVAEATGATGYNAVFRDAMLNIFLTSPYYYGLYRQHGLSKEFAQEALPQLVMDVGMAWNTRGKPEDIVLNANSKILSNMLDIPQDQARKILKNNIAEFNKVMQAQDVIRENEQKVFGLTNGTIEDAYFKTSEQARELAKLALDEAQRVYKADKDKPWHMPREEFERRLAENRAGAGDVQAAKALAEEALQYYRTLSVIANEGGINVKELAAKLGDYAAIEIKSLEQNAVKDKGGTELARIVEELNRTGVPVKDEFDLLDRLKNVPAIGRDEALKILAGEQTEADPVVKNLHYNLVKEAMARGEIPSQEAVKEYPALKARLAEMAKIPSIDDIKKTPEMLKNIAAAVGDADLLTVKKMASKTLGLPAEAAKRLNDVLEAIIDDLVEMPTDERMIATSRVEVERLLESLRMPQSDIERIPEPDRSRVADAVAGKIEPTLLPEEWRTIMKEEPFNPKVKNLLAVYDAALKIREDGMARKKALVEAQMQARTQAAAELADEMRRLYGEKRKLQAEAKARKAKELYIKENGNEIEELRVKENAFGMDEAPSWVKKMVGREEAWFGRPSRVFDLLDGFKNYMGKIHQTFMGGADRAEKMRFEMYSPKREAFHKFMEDIGMKFTDLSKPFTRFYIASETGAPKTVTLDQMLNIVALWDNPTGRYSVELEYGLNENDIARIRQSLTPKELKLLDYVKESYREIYPKLRDYMLAHFDYILPEEGNYVRIYRERPNYTGDIFDDVYRGLVDEARERRYMRRYVGHTFTKERTALGAQELPRLRLGLVSNYLSYLYETTYFMSYGEFARQTAYMLGSKSPLIEEVRRTFGDDVVRALQDWQKRIADPSGYKAHSAFDAAIRFFKENATIAWLAGNISTFMKQLASAFFVANEAGWERTFAGLLDVATDWKTTRKFVLDHSHYAKNREMEQVLSEIEKGGKQYNFARQFGKELAMPLMAGIKAFDSIVVTAGWTAVYNKYKDLGWSDEAAAMRADRVMLNTQEASYAKELPMIYTQNEMLNMFMIFTNQLNNIWNMTTHDLYGYFKRGEIPQALATVASLALSGLIINSIEDRKMPEGPQDILDGFVSQAVDSIPLAGKALSGMREGFRANSDPLTLAVSAVGRVAMKAWQDGIPGAMSDPALVYQAWCLCLGYPYTGPKRVVDAVKQNDITLLLGEKGAKKGPVPLSQKKIKPLHEKMKKR